NDAMNSDDYKLKRKRQKANRRAHTDYRQHEQEQQRKRREINHPIDEKNTIDDTDSEESDDERNMFDIFNHGSSVELRNSENSDTSGSEDDSSQDDDCEDNNLNDDEIFIIVNSVHKIKINDKEIDKLNRQNTREGHATRVDRYLFLGGEKSYKFNNKKKKQRTFHEEFNTTESDDENEIRCSCENDDYLIKTWQNTISSRKKIEIDDNIDPQEINILKPST
ncbi:12516_t:CDS:2, partial [Gigaspora rosea]